MPDEASPHSSAKLQVHDFLIEQLTAAIEKLDHNIDGMRADIASSKQQAFEIRLQVQGHTEAIRELQEASDELQSRNTVNAIAASSRSHRPRPPRLSPVMRHAITALVTSVATLAASYVATLAKSDPAQHQEPKK